MQPDERLIDVGCGMGDMAVAYAASGAAVTAVDFSEAMLDAARARAAIDEVSVEFRVGDATALDFADDSFDACRSERVLQWLPDVAVGLAEIRRVVRPGGRVCLVDSDWRTLALDLDDLNLGRLIGDAMMGQRGASAAAGGRLLNLCREAGFVDLECTADTHVWTEWDPDTTPNPSGLFPLRVVMPQLVESGLVDADSAERFLEGVFAAGRAGRFFMSLSMMAVFGRVPT